MKEHITIGKKAFVAPVRYLEGHVCTEQEANQLNRDIIGKARNNLATKDGLTQEDLDRWIGNFTFGSRGNGRDPYKFTVKNVINEMERNRGKKFSVKELNKMMVDPKVVEEVQRRVKQITALSEAHLANG